MSTFSTFLPLFISESDRAQDKKTQMIRKAYSLDHLSEKPKKDDEYSRAMSDCVPSPSSEDSSYASSSGSRNSSTGSSTSPSCEISLLERLIRTHPVWFLPSLQRSGALHLLQGREVGNFIVRSSTQPMTMAVSVKLPGNHVEHYLLKAVDNRIALENSTHTFETVHQLIAHYCALSDEIPVCLRVPNAIADSTSRQQLRSLALLGQEFWTVSSSGSGKELSSPSDIDISKNFISSGLGSQSSSSQNSLSDLRKPCRPTTLELGSGGCGRGGISTPPPVPPRWSRSALLTPLSLPSSVQSTPSEIQSTFSEKNGRFGKKKKRSSGGKTVETPSIHYKDTEILDLFKGTKTLYDDKASDYEDIWSPQYQDNGGKRSVSTVSPPRLSTFKPDIIASSLASDLDISHKQSHFQFQSLSMLVNQEPNDNENNVMIVKRENRNNNRLSLNGFGPKTGLNSKGEKKNGNNGNKEGGFYSEPVDAISFRRFATHRLSEPNMRWSQPMLSLVQVPTPCEKNQNELARERNQHHRISLANVNMNATTRSKDSSSSSSTSIGNRNHQKNHSSMGCASVDNLCHLRDIRKRAKKFNCGHTEGDEDEEFMVTKEKERPKSGEILTASNKISGRENGNKKGSRADLDKERREEREMLDISNKSWRLDNSWEFVMWEKNEEGRYGENLTGSSCKFPLSTPPNSPSCIEEAQDRVFGETGKRNSQLMNRFSRYDNLEGGGNEEEISEESDFHEEKISQPWDSSKWEHLLRLVSESSNQLDSIQMNDKSKQMRNNQLNLRTPNDSTSSILKEIKVSSDVLGSEPRQRISKILEVNGNVDKAGKLIANLVRDLSERENGVFGPTLKSFKSCTITAKVQDPQKIMRNIRQFISGMKNYLVGVSPETNDLRSEIKKQTELLSDTEFLNIDAILEEVLIDLVISPLNFHIRSLIDEQSVKSNVDYSPLLCERNYIANSMPRLDIERQEMIEKLQRIYTGLEDSVSPLKKLDKWNEFVCLVQDMEDYSSESFLPLLAEMLGTVCSSKLPSHVEYMIGLLPHSLAEQNNYSISLLLSALSALRAKDEKGKCSKTSVRVIVPDERNGTLIRKMVPVRETTTNKDVAKIVASKLGIANPGDYILVRIKNGEERLCPEGELVSQFVEDSGTALAYKRIDAKIGWPQRIH